MLKIVNLVGARPQFIKSAGISREMANDPDLQEIYVHSGQHYDPEMSERFFEELNLPQPEHHLLAGDFSGREQVAFLRERLTKLFQEIKPDAVIVYGDTNTTLAGAWAARDSNVPLAHIEAGLRSYNHLMPEEYSRVQTDRLSRWLFCPTPTAVANLAKEGLLSTSTRKVMLCGDVMYDNIKFFGDRVDLPFVTEKTQGRNYALLTIHRNYNTDDRTRLFPLLNNVIQLMEERKLVALIPLHPRLARVAKEDEKVAEMLKHPSLITIEPVSYGETLSLIKMANFVMTDSGGIQKEAAMLGRKVLVVRTETEWVEWVQAGFAFVVDIDLDRMRKALETQRKPGRPPKILQQITAPIIVQTIKNDLIG